MEGSLRNGMYTRLARESSVGGAPGINSIIEVEGGIAGGYLVIVMSNLDPPAAMNVSALARSWLTRIE